MNKYFDVSDIVFLAFLVLVLIVYAVVRVILYFRSKHWFDEELKRLQEKDDLFWQEQECKVKEMQEKRLQH